MQDIYLISLIINYYIDYYLLTFNICILTPAPSNTTNFCYNSGQLVLYLDTFYLDTLYLDTGPLKYGFQNAQASTASYRC